MLRNVKLAEAVGSLERLTEAVVARVASDIESQAKQRAPVDTGHLRASGGTRRIAPMIHEVAFSAHYAAYVELGTRYMTARPFLGPAASAAAVSVKAAGLVATLSP